MTLTEAARALGLHPSTLSHQVAAGRLRVKRYGRAVIVTPAEVERYRAEQLGRRRSASQ